MDKNYFLLRTYLKDKKTFKVLELEKVLNCSSKTVKRYILKLQSNDILKFTPGIGRGNMSEIFFANNLKYEYNLAIRESLLSLRYDDLIFLLNLQLPKEWIGDNLEEINNLFDLNQNFENKLKFRSVVARDVLSMDPRQACAALEVFLLKQLGETPLNYDDCTKEVIPNIFHHWELSKSKKNWIFYIRNGVQFHNGQILTSDDIKYTLEMAKENSPSISWALKNISSIICINQSILQINLYHPNLFFLRILSCVNLTIVPKNYNYDSNLIISLGAFKIEERTSSKILLKSFNNYFKIRPLIDYAEFWILNKNNFITLPPISSVKIELYDGFNFLIFNEQKNPILKDINIKKLFLVALYDLSKQYKFTISNYFNNSKLEVFKSDNLNASHLTLKSLPKLTIGLISFANNETEYSLLKSLIEFLDINITIVNIPKDKFFEDNFIESNIDIFLAGEVPSNDLEFSFLQFIRDTSLLPQRFLSSETIELINTMSLDYIDAIRSIDNYLFNNLSLIYFTANKRQHVVSGNIKTEIVNTFGYPDLKTLWFSDEY